MVCIALELGDLEGNGQLKDLLVLCLFCFAHFTVLITARGRLWVGL
jgi:hypothetical protein